MNRNHLTGAIFVGLTSAVMWTLGYFCGRETAEAEYRSRLTESTELARRADEAVQKANDQTNRAIELVNQADRLLERANDRIKAKERP